MSVSEDNKRTFYKNDNAIVATYYKDLYKQQKLGGTYTPCEATILTFGEESIYVDKCNRPKHDEVKKNDVKNGLKDNASIKYIQSFRKDIKEPSNETYNTCKVHKSNIIPYEIFANVPAADTQAQDTIEDVSHLKTRLQYYKTQKEQLNVLKTKISDAESKIREAELNNITLKDKNSDDINRLKVKLQEQMDKSNERLVKMETLAQTLEIMRSDIKATNVGESVVAPVISTVTSEQPAAEAVRMASEADRRQSETDQKTDEAQRTAEGTEENRSFQLGTYTYQGRKINDSNFAKMIEKGKFDREWTLYQAQSKQTLQNGVSYKNLTLIKKKSSMYEKTLKIDSNTFQIKKDQEVSSRIIPYIVYDDNTYIILRIPTGTKTFKWDNDKFKGIQVEK